MSKIINKTLKIIFLYSTLMCLSSCAYLHHVQVGEIDSTGDNDLIPFEIKVSEFGIDLNDAKSTSKILMNSKNSKQADEILTMLQYFQMGPKTGAPVFSVAYVNHLENKIRENCPSGRVTGIMSIREARQYPVIKGEIVKIKGYCLRSKKEKI
ncbi:MAG: hypothetical protein L6Q37_03410 [Bdellovibrionaceae bacterium]|nr:hypothetical protein [Pseudobdellovibrionaceae bacterium]NUM59743.1 hypothetical protein [Pseudobdellovibrionaceae bacterium]